MNGANISDDTNEMSKRLNKIRNTDFSIAIKILFYLMMITSGIRSVINVFSGYAYYRLSQADSRFSLWENSFALSLVNMFGTIINIVGIILILKRKMVGFILLVVVTVFLPIITECLGIDVASTIILGLIRLAVISLVLLIRNDGVSGWAIITATDKDSDQINPDTPSADNVPAIIEEQKDVEEDSFLTTEKVDEVDDKSIAEIVDNQDSITNESDKIPVENQEENHSNEVEISQEVEPTEDNNVEVKPNETKPKKRMKPWLIALIVVFSVLVAGGLAFYIYISSKHNYPKDMESFADKVCYYYNIPNHRLAKKYLKKAQNAKDNELIELYEEYVKKAYSIDPNNYDVLMEMSVMYEDSDIIEAQNKVYEIIVNGYAKNDNDLYDAYERCIQLANKIHNSTENNKRLSYGIKSNRWNFYVSIKHYYGYKDDFNTFSKFVNNTENLEEFHNYIRENYGYKDDYETFSNIVSIDNNIKPDNNQLVLYAQKMFEIHPKKVESFYALALAYFNSGHFDNSMKWIQKFLSKADGSMVDGSHHWEEIKWARFALAACYYYLDNNGEAINQYNVAKQDYPTSYYVDMFSFILGKPFEIFDMSVIVDGKSRIVYKPSEVVHITGKSDLSLLIELEPNITDSFNVDVRLFYNDKNISVNSNLKKVQNKLNRCGYDYSINDMAIALENEGDEFQKILNIFREKGYTGTKHDLIEFVNIESDNYGVTTSKRVQFSTTTKYTIDCVKYSKSCKSYSGKYRFEVWSNGFLIGSETYDLVAE